jgi:hypothetical protein
MAITTINKVALYNKALGLVGDYNLSVGADTITNSLFTTVDSTFNVATYTMYSDLISANNYTEVFLTGATLVGNYYQFTIPTTTKLLRPHLIINVKTYQTYNFTDLVTRAAGDGIFITGSTLLQIHKDFVPTVATLSDIKFCYFFSPIIAGVYTTATIITIDEYALEALCLKVASTLAVFLGNDLNLSQTLENGYQLLMQKIKSNQDLGYGRPYFAKFSRGINTR